MRLYQTAEDRILPQLPHVKNKRMGGSAYAKDVLLYMGKDQ
jgi:hypothetical protein